MLLADKILELSRELIEGGGLIVGQNLEAVQNVQGTIPTGQENVLITPTTEVAGVGLAIGMALSGRPTVHVLRFGSFAYLQSSPLVFYAARARELWGYECPLFVRISCDDGLGPVHTGQFHSLFMHQPGLCVAAPCTAKEYQDVFDWWKNFRCPIIVSEHRSCYRNELPLENDLVFGAPMPAPKIYIVAIGGARIHAQAAKAALALQGIEAAVKHISWLRPFPEEIAAQIEWSASIVRRVLFVDAAYEPCSVAEHLALRLAQNVSCEVRVVGMPQKSPGVGEGGALSVMRIIREAKQLLNVPLKSF